MTHEVPAERHARLVGAAEQAIETIDAFWYQRPRRWADPGACRAFHPAAPARISNALGPSQVIELVDYVLQSAQSQGATNELIDDMYRAMIPRLQ